MGKRICRRLCLYKTEAAFDTDYFTEIFLGLKDHYSIYSDEYNDLVDATEDKLQTAADKRSDLRYQKSSRTQRKAVRWSKGIR